MVFVTITNNPLINLQFNFLFCFLDRYWLLNFLYLLCFFIFCCWFDLTSINISWWPTTKHIPYFHFLKECLLTSIFFFFVFVILFYNLTRQTIVLISSWWKHFSLFFYQLLLAKEVVHVYFLYFLWFHLFSLYELVFQIVLKVFDVLDFGTQILILYLGLHRIDIILTGLIRIVIINLIPPITWIIWLLIKFQFTCHILGWLCFTYFYYLTFCFVILL